MSAHAKPALQTPRVIAIELALQVHLNLTFRFQINDCSTVRCNNTNVLKYRQIINDAIFESLSESLRAISHYRHI